MRQTSVQSALVQRAWPTGHISRSDGHKAGFLEHSLRRDVLVAGLRFERSQTILLGREPAQLSQRRGRHTATRHLLGNPVADVGSSVLEVIQVEAPNHRPVPVEQHVKDAHPGVLLGQKRAVSLRELLKELIAAIADGCGEVGPVRHLKSEDRGGVITPKTLQLKHRPSVSSASRTRARLSSAPRLHSQALHATVRMAVALAVVDCARDLERLADGAPPGARPEPPKHLGYAP
ncbi:MAG TPA: hypothetical protein VMS00_10200 [Acidimicrobiales bacterium]|nr:hypothetical protein [Acidimicrobiales bacterium]